MDENGIVGYDLDAARAPISRRDVVARIEDMSITATDRPLPQISAIYPKEIPNEFSSFRFDENRVLAKPLDVTTGLSEVDPPYCGP